MQSYQTEAQMFKSTWKKVWWAALIQGAVALIFGLYAIFNRDTAPETLVQLIGVLVIVNGLIEAFVALTQRNGSDRWRELGGTGVTAVVGFIIFALAGSIAKFTLGIAIYFVGAILLVAGIIAILAAFTRRDWSLIISGAFRLFLAFVLFAFTEGTANFIVLLVGSVMVILGFIGIILAFVLRVMGKAVTPLLDDETLIGEAELVNEKTTTVEGQLLEGEIVE